MVKNPVRSCQNPFFLFELWSPSRCVAILIIGIRPTICRGLFKCEKAWRFWSEVEQGVHYAVYQFGDKTGVDTALASEEFKELVADFSRSWPEGVSRTRDVVTLIEEVTAQYYEKALSCVDVVPS